MFSTESPLRDVAARLSRTRCSPGDAGNGSSSAQLHVTSKRKTLNITVGFGRRQCSIVLSATAAKAAKEIRSAGRDRVHAEVTLKATSSEREGAEADRGGWNSA